MSARALGSLDRALKEVLADFERRITELSNRRGFGGGGQSVTLPGVPTVNISLVHGSDTTIVLTFRDRATNTLINWTGQTFTARAYSGVGGSVLATATTSHNGSGGAVTIVWPATQTVLLAVGLTGVWDLKASPLGQTVAIGSFIVQGV